MPGDYTRFTHKPHKRYSAVLQQQGRVQLDSDWNEQAEILKRRIEILTMDVFGKCSVPISDPANELAFNITITGSDLLIGPGRMYVDGLLVENLQSSSYLNQPFFPKPPAVPDIAHLLAYLDVWEREITYVQDRDLLEKALSGADTATRIQTVWQVRLMPGDCKKALPGPSAGRLSTRAVGTASSDDECVINPAGGYRGLENRLYRVEIHDAGDLASVRFKWSRDNACVVSSIEAVDQDRLTVSRIGRDKTLRFKTGDSIEILDDDHELMEHHGEMAKIIKIDEANREITLDHAPAPFDTSRHARVIRWDQSGLVAGSSSWIALEDGVEVKLSLDAASGDSFNAGDYWVFAARTADGSVEEITDAPPRGIIHHYCHLAETGNTGAKAQKGRNESAAMSVPVRNVNDCRHKCKPCGDEHA